MAFFLFQRLEKFQRVFINHLQNPNAYSILIIYIQKLQAQSHPRQYRSQLLYGHKMPSETISRIYKKGWIFSFLPHQNRCHAE